MLPPQVTITDYLGDIYKLLEEQEKKISYLEQPLRMYVLEQEKHNSNG